MQVSLHYWIIGILGSYAIVSTWYIRRLRQHIRAYEQEWMCIDEIADHNRDGDVIVHVRHLGKDDVD